MVERISAKKHKKRKKNLEKKTNVKALALATVHAFLNNPDPTPFFNDKKALEFMGYTWPLLFPHLSKSKKQRPQVCRVRNEEASLFNYAA